MEEAKELTNTVWEIPTKLETLEAEWVRLERQDKQLELFSPLGSAAASGSTLVLPEDHDFGESDDFAFMLLSEFGGCFHTVADTESGISGFYSPLVNDPWMQPDSITRFVSEINAVDLAINRFNKKVKSCVHGITSLKKFCKKHIWTDEENRVLHVDFVRSKNQKSQSITDLHHSVWFFANEHKDNKSYIHNVINGATHDERKVVVVDEDVIHYCTGRYKLPNALKEKPILLARREVLESICIETIAESRKRKASMISKEVAHLNSIDFRLASQSSKSNNILSEDTSY